MLQEKKISLEYTGVVTSTPQLGAAGQLYN